MRNGDDVDTGMCNGGNLEFEDQEPLAVEHAREVLTMWDELQLLRARVKTLQEYKDKYDRSQNELVQQCWNQAGRTLSHLLDASKHGHVEETIRHMAGQNGYDPLQGPAEDPSAGTTKEP